MKGQIDSRVCKGWVKGYWMDRRWVEAGYLLDRMNSNGKMYASCMRTQIQG